MEVRYPVSDQWLQGAKVVQERGEGHKQRALRLGTPG